MKAGHMQNRKEITCDRFGTDQAGLQIRNRTYTSVT